MSLQPPGAARRRPRVGRWVLLVLLLVPVIEVAAVVGVGKAIGPWPTIALLLVESLLGAWLVRREGRRAWQALSGAVRTGSMPSSELADAALVLLGGLLLLIPGFVTDVLGFLVILPWTRPFARRMLEQVIAQRLPVGGRGAPGSTGSTGPGDVIRGEVVDG